MENTPKVFVLETQKIQNGVTVYTEFFMDFSFFFTESNSNFKGT